jgi:uncharacterized protein
MDVVDLSQRAAVLDKEFRDFSPALCELREGSDDTLGVRGYASVYSTPYGVRDALGEYEETIEPGAFKRSVDNKDDVRLLLNHDPNYLLARTKSGTLRLDPDDPAGLLVDADLEARMSRVNDVRLSMARGDLDQMSFAFKATRQEWSKDYTQRSIREVKLIDVSIVTYPASPSTSVGLRAADVSACEVCAAYHEAKHGQRAELPDEVRAVAEGAWNGDASRFSDEQWRTSCLLDMGGDGTAKERYKLPVREPDGTVSRNACHAAAAVLGGGRGGVKAPAAAIASAKRKLAALYTGTLDEKPPPGLRSLDVLRLEVARLDMLTRARNIA